MLPEHKEGRPQAALGIRKEAPIATTDEPLLTSADIASIKSLSVGRGQARKKLAATWRDTNDALSGNKYNIKTYGPLVVSDRGFKGLTIKADPPVAAAYHAILEQSSILPSEDYYSRHKRRIFGAVGGAAISAVSAWSLELLNLASAPLALMYGSAGAVLSGLSYAIDHLRDKRAGDEQTTRYVAALQQLDPSRTLAHPQEPETNFLEFNHFDQIKISSSNIPVIQRKFLEERFKKISDRIIEPSLYDYRDSTLYVDFYKLVKAELELADNPEQAWDSYLRDDFASVRTQHTRLVELKKELSRQTARAKFLVDSASGVNTATDIRATKRQIAAIDRSLVSHTTVMVDRFCRKLSLLDLAKKREALQPKIEEEPNETTQWKVRVLSDLDTTTRLLTEHQHGFAGTQQAAKVLTKADQVIKLLGDIKYPQDNNRTAETLYKAFQKWCRKQGLDASPEVPAVTQYGPWPILRPTQRDTRTTNSDNDR